MKIGLWCAFIYKRQGVALKGADNLNSLYTLRSTVECAHVTRAFDWTTATFAHLPDARASHSLDRLNTSLILGCAHLVVTSDTSK